MAFDRDEDQQQQRDDVDRQRPLLPTVIVDERDAEHHDDAHDRKDRWLFHSRGVRSCSVADEMNTMPTIVSAMHEPAVTN